MIFENKKEEKTQEELYKLEQYEYKSKYGFLDELKGAVRTDEEYAKFKGYID